MMNLLFVCTANICRSYLAERLFLHEAGRKGLSHIHAASAGVSALSGSGPDPAMVDYLMTVGGAAGDHTSRQLETDTLAWADRVFVMSRDHREFIDMVSPADADKVEFLAKYAGGGDTAEIADPFGRTRFHYRTAISQIHLAVRRLAEQLAET